MGMSSTSRRAANTPMPPSALAASASMTSPTSTTKASRRKSPLRRQLAENEEQLIHLLYGYLYVADKEEGLVIIGDPNLRSKSPGVGTLLDGNPANNFLKRAVTFNPKGVLTGARRIAIAGTFAYVLTDKALVVVDLDNPLAPRVTANVGEIGRAHV